MNKRLSIGLWTAQALLAAVFVATGGMKTLLAPADLFRILPDLASLPLPFVRFLGVAELAAAAGLILPSLTRIAPFLTPLAASGVIVVMVGALVVHVRDGHFAKLPLVLILGALACFVAWGRFTRLRIRPRTRRTAYVL
ncbi:MAG TPA: DoxX family protein [Thermoanaerobaculia bacterium]|nr:DoxX family protein [Thermoanaerobaculia bacterium]